MPRALARTARSLVVGVVALGICACTSRGSETAQPHSAAVVGASHTVDPSAASSSPGAPSTNGLAPASNPVCVLTESDIDLVDDLRLRIEESRPFLNVPEAKKLEVRIATPLSTAQVWRPDLDVIGHVKIADVGVRLRSDALVDGYLRVRRGRLRLESPTQLTVSVRTPPFLAPVKALEPLRVSCDELALARRVTSGRRGTPVGLQRGKPIELRATPGGPVVAKMSFAKQDRKVPAPSLEVFEIERQGREVRVRVEDVDADVEGWVGQDDLAPSAHGALLLDPSAAFRVARGTEIVLEREEPLFVRTADGVVRVGTARPGALQCKVPSSPEAREVQVEVPTTWAGLMPAPGPADATMFVVAPQGATCAAARTP